MVSFLLAFPPKFFFMDTYFMETGFEVRDSTAVYK
jgi:hypothetical protein